MLSRRKFVIPCLRAVADAARKYADSDPVLALALADVDEADSEATQRHNEALEHKGIDCVHCGRRFISSEFTGYDPFCSIGCRIRDR